MLEIPEAVTPKHDAIFVRVDINLGRQMLGKNRHQPATFLSTTILSWCSAFLLHMYPKTAADVSTDMAVVPAQSIPERCLALAQLLVVFLPKSHCVGVASHPNDRIWAVCRHLSYLILEWRRSTLEISHRRRSASRDCVEGNPTVVDREWFVWYRQDSSS